jgi:hypothetical protein
MIKKFFNKDDKPFFIGLLIMNIFIISIAEIVIIHPLDIFKKEKYKHVDKREKNENSR